MPPQPGVFPVPYGVSQHKGREGTYGDVDMVYHHPGPSTRVHEEGKKEKRRKDISGKVGKEMHERREDGRNYNETISALHSASLQLSMRPETNAMFKLRLYPLSLERSALLASLEFEERYARDCAEQAYKEERDRVEEEYRRGRQRVRERLLEGIEERRRRAREEKDGEGTVGDAALDTHSRPPITRKLRNKLGTSPPPTPHGVLSTTHPTGPSGISHLPITTGPFVNPHSLSVDEIPSPFPLALTATSAPSNGAAAASAPTGTTNGRRRQKGGAGHQNQAVGGLGKSIAMLCASKDHEIESDLGDIRRGSKRRRTAQTAA
ncbi:hypothetical protein FA15DRAFT_668811 [Coprinopsis marcescibilis]|uniref:Centrosomal protein ATPase n=1 Tax=Coprinopsis marcescibilis TaxID=230819 RepID=A0A5C3KWS4_COPMA|nr:hypothetical protein FA15DRAFT_668811 [Coprinopsis marcescibilis]